MKKLYLLPLVMAVACEDEPSEPVYTPIPLLAGAPLAGVSSGFLRLPAGVPLGGYTSRDAAFGGTRTRPRDLRKSPWTHKFHPSAGQLTGTPLQALWLSNADRHMVLLRIDLIGAFDGIVFEIEKRLSAVTGLALKGQVAMVTSHSHSSPAAHHQSLQFALGFDRYDPRIFERIVAQAVEQALAAHSALAPAKIGYGLMPQADPRDGQQLWRDRRGENDELLDMDGQATGPGFKDPSAGILKVESMTGELLGVLLNIGLHGTAFGDDNVWSHWDAPGAVAYGLSAALGGVPVFLLQGAGGDTSPAGRGETAMAVVDDLARRAAARLAPLVAATQVSADPLIMEMSSLSLAQSHQSFTVRRRGSSNFRYAPVSLNEYGEPIEIPDNRVYDAQGAVIELIDEFPALLGAGLCGEGVGVPFGALGMGFSTVTVPPYETCAVLDRLMPVIASRYEVDLATTMGGSAAQPRNIEPAMAHSLVGFGFFGGISMTIFQEGDAETQKGRLALMFLPGETTTLYTLRAKRYLKDLGYDGAMLIGYAMDHEGYLLTIEDWLIGGYEPSINVWGPLQGEYLLEGAMQLAERGLSEHRIRVDDIGVEAPDYGAPDLGFEPISDVDEPTPNAGTVPVTLPEAGVLLPLNLDSSALDATASTVLLRALTDVYAGSFEGGDVAIDSPLVHLERSLDGAWQPVVGGDGLPVNSDGPGVLLGYSPSPPRSLEAVRQHLWTVVWQPVGEGTEPGAWAAMTHGSYRFVAQGRARRSAEGELESYKLELPSFEIIPAEIQFVDGVVSYQASALSYRLRAVLVSPNAPAPLPEGMILGLVCRIAGEVTFESDVSVGPSGNLELVPPGDGSSCSLRDAYGNAGSL
ncbi:MAG: hypothetical protein OSB21_09700 [Myxococcota bacterium]|nr:hypothetical protein [Myxococcota bacterium]